MTERRQPMDTVSGTLAFEVWLVRQTALGAWRRRVHKGERGEGVISAAIAAVIE